MLKLLQITKPKREVPRKDCIYFTMKKQRCQEEICGEILVDKSSTGKVQPWALHKYTSVLLSMAYATVNLKKSERVRDCAEYTEWRIGGDGMKLHNADFCRVRLCPMCQWRRGLKVYSQMRDIVSDEAVKDLRYISLTLTVRNCVPESLSITLDRLMEGFNRLMKYKAVSRVVKGYYRGTEVTHNIRANTYHPHFHVLLAVNKSYFKSKDYLSQKRWVEMWRKAMKLDYDPSVDVRTVKGELAKALAEFAKYTCKPNEYIMPDKWELTVETVEVLDKALDKRRFVGLGGIFSEIHKRLHLDDMEDGDLTLKDKDTLAEGEEIVRFWWHTGYKQYIR
jgi:plasmid rolling circle replication initiator protein Rep